MANFDENKTAVENSQRTIPYVDMNKFKAAMITEVSTSIWRDFVHVAMTGNEFETGWALINFCSALKKNVERPYLKVINEFLGAPIPATIVTEIGTAAQDWVNEFFSLLVKDSYTC